MRSVQVELGLPTRLLKGKVGSTGRNVPEKGAVPEAIDVAAASEKTVFLKFEPAPPLLFARGITPVEKHWVYGVL
jgi:hypothetical protein